MRSGYRVPRDESSAARCCTTATRTRRRAGEAPMSLAIREALLAFRRAPAAERRSSVTHDRLLALRLRALRARGAQHPRRAARGGGARGDPRVHRRRHRAEATIDAAIGDIGAFPEVGERRLREPRRRRSRARARELARVQRRLRGRRSSRPRSRSGCARASAIPVTVQALADRIRGVRLHRRRALRRGVGGRSCTACARSPDRRRRRRSAWSSPLVAVIIIGSTIRMAVLARAARSRSCDSWAPRTASCALPVPDRRHSSRGCWAACSRVLLTWVTHVADLALRSSRRRSSTPAQLLLGVLAGALIGLLGQRALGRAAPARGVAGRLTGRRGPRADALLCARRASLRSAPAHAARRPPSARLRQQQAGAARSCGRSASELREAHGRPAAQRAHARRRGRQNLDRQADATSRLVRSSRSSWRRSPSKWTRPPVAWCARRTSCSASAPCSSGACVDIYKRGPLYSAEAMLSARIVRGARGALQVPVRGGARDRALVVARGAAARPDRGAARRCSCGCRTGSRATGRRRPQEEQRLRVARAAAAAPPHHRAARRHADAAAPHAAGPRRGAARPT